MASAGRRDQVVGPGLGDCAGAGEMVPAKKRINKKKKKERKKWINGPFIQWSIIQP